MIDINEFAKIGTLGKSHGIKGEISLFFTSDVLEEKDCSYIVCLIDRIPVPFFIENYRSKGSQSAIIKLTGIDTDTEARQMAGLDVYYPLSEMNVEEEKFSLDYFIGFKIVDDLYGEIGHITDVDDSTLNTLFLAEGMYGEVLIPANKDLIINMDHQERIIHMVIPEGLI